VVYALMRVCKLMCVRASAPRVCVHFKSMCVLCVYAGANCQENDAETTCTSHERASKCDTEVRTTRTHTHTRAHARARALSSLLSLSLSLLSLSLSLLSLSLHAASLSPSCVHTHARTRARTHRYEQGLAVPTNAELAKMDKILGTKLPRIKKLTTKQDELEKGQTHPSLRGGPA